MEDRYMCGSITEKRLIKEYMEHNSLVIAFDFDNTVFDYHNQGDTYPRVIRALRSAALLGCHLICFTANTDTKRIEEYLQKHDIPYNSINENPPFFKCDARKIYYNILLDDRAGLREAIQTLEIVILFIARQKGLCI